MACLRSTNNNRQSLLTVITRGMKANIARRLDHRRVGELVCAGLTYSKGDVKNGVLLSEMYYVVLLYSCLFGTLCTSLCMSHRLTSWHVGSWL